MQYTAHPGNRPDLAAAGPSQSNSAMFRESGVDLTQNQQSATGPSQGIPTAAPQKRPEMRGPQINSDIDSLLSGLKPKTQPQPQPVFEEPVTQQGAESIISISSLKDLDGTTMPKKSKKRHNSSNRSNTVSLDI